VKRPETEDQVPAPGAAYGVAPIAAEGIFAYGDTLSADGSVSFIRHLHGGHVPVQGYFFRGGGRSLMMDGGLAVHRERIISSLAALLEQGEAPSYLASRWEPDAIVNLPDLVKRFGVRKVLSIGELSPLDFFTELEQATARGQLALAGPGISRQSLRPGDIIEVGDLRLEVLRTSLRLLLTNWFYEHRTGSLFTADSWSLVTTARGDLRVRATDRSQLSQSKIERSLTSKFDWLIGANPVELVADLENLVTTRRINRICPTVGGVIEGADNVRLVFERTVAALRSLSSRSQPSALANAGWQKLKAELQSVQTGAQT